MTQKALKKLLSKEKLKEWAGEKVYNRGIAYHLEGHVDLLFYEPRKAAAEVHGTHLYRIDFEVSKDGHL